nr:unnamed protein product [Digitaria exilis]
MSPRKAQTETERQRYTGTRGGEEGPDRTAKSQRYTGTPKVDADALLRIDLGFGEEELRGHEKTPYRRRDPSTQQSWEAREVAATTTTTTALRERGEREGETLGKESGVAEYGKESGIAEYAVFDYGERKQKMNPEHWPSASLGMTKARKKWSPPVGEGLKINVDGAYIGETGAAALGVNIRDSTGKPVLMAARLLSHCGDAETAEALACLEGLRMGARCADRDMVLEADNVAVIEKLRMGGTDRSAVSPVIHDALQEMRLLHKLMGRNGAHGPRVACKTLSACRLQTEDNSSKEAAGLTHMAPGGCGATPVVGRRRRGWPRDAALADCRPRAWLWCTVATANPP